MPNIHSENPNPLPKSTESVLEETRLQDPEYYKKLLRTIALAGVVLTAVVGVAHFLDRNPDRSRSGPPAMQTYTIERGDTEWELAGMISPNTDAREMVDEIDALVPKDSAHANRTLQPGDMITYSDGHVVGYTERGASDS